MQRSRLVALRTNLANSFRYEGTTAHRTPVVITIPIPDQNAVATKLEDTAAEAQDDEDDYLRDALKSSWYKDYIRNGNPPHGAKLLKTFKKRFNMTFVTFQDLVKKAKDNEWFPDYEKDYTFGQKNVSLDILILTRLT